MRAGPAATLPDFDALVERLRAAGAAMPASHCNNESTAREVHLENPARRLLLAAAAAVPPTARPPPPQLEATAWVLVDQSSGQMLAGHRANETIEPASITKFMTAYAVFHALKDGKLKLETQVPISERAWRSEGSRTYLDLSSACRSRS